MEYFIVKYVVLQRGTCEELRNVTNNMTVPNKCMLYGITILRNQLNTIWSSFNSIPNKPTNADGRL